MFEVIPAFSPEHRRAAVALDAWCALFPFRGSSMDTRVWSPPTFLKKCLMMWRFTSPTTRAVTPRTTRPGQRAKGYILFHTSPLSSISSFFNLLPALLFFPLLRLCLCCVTAGCFFDGSLKENRKLKRDSLLNTETSYNIPDWGTLFLCQMFCGEEMWTVNEIAYS